MRTLARVVKIDAILEIPNADAIEAAKVGGWTVVVKKSEFKSGDFAVYFEIDSFLPDGNSSWQFLIDKSSRNYNGLTGHVLKSVKLRGQVSQGLLLSLSSCFNDPTQYPEGLDVSEILGIVKYEPPVPAELAGIVRGPYPSRVPKTDQERIQNLAIELEEWKIEKLSWEITEKLEGASCSFIWIESELHVCSRNLSLKNTEENSLWKIAKELDIESKFAKHFSGRNIALQGEVVGFGINGNIYQFNNQKFFLFDIYEIDKGCYLRPSERRNVALRFGIEHVPVVLDKFTFDDSVCMESLLSMSDGQSQLRVEQLREGLVFKSHEKPVSFKVVSNKYLLKQK